MVEEKRSKAVKELNKALQNIARHTVQIPIILYGKYYVIYKGVEGITWKVQPKHFATIELSQRTKHASLDDRLFQLVSC